MILKAFKYRIYPTVKQEILLAKHFGCARFIYNWGLNLKITHYKQTKKSISKNSIIKEITKLKQQAETSWLQEVNSQSLQQSILNLDIAFTNFFKKRSSFPKFKSKKNKQSFQCPQNVKIDFDKYLLQLPKFDKPIKMAKDRIFNGNIKTCTISKVPSGKYYISVLVETNEIMPPKPEINKSQAIGIDLGLKDFLTDSNGNKVEHPKYLKKSEKKLKRLQHKYSQKKKGSKNSAKYRIKLAKQHEKISNQRNDFLHKLSSKYIRENQTICLEDLNVSGMLKNHNLAKSISDASWYRFVQYLQYKSEWYGKNLLFINRFDPSSKMCNVCGNIKQDLSLQDRNWICNKCNSEHDRDINAARNILDFAFHKQNLVNKGYKIPEDIREFKPVLSLKRKSTKGYRDNAARGRI